MNFEPFIFFQFQSTVALCTRQFFFFFLFPENDGCRSDQNFTSTLPSARQRDVKLERRGWNYQQGVVIPPPPPSKILLPNWTIGIHEAKIRLWPETCCESRAAEAAGENFIPRPPGADLDSDRNRSSLRPNAIAIRARGEESNGGLKSNERTRDDTIVGTKSF